MANTTDNSTPASISRVGFWSGMLAAGATVVYDVVQLLQVAGTLRYPLDEVLIYGTSFCIVVPFMLLMLALHHLTAPNKRYWTHAALLFTVIYAVFVSANYVVQLATVLPMGVAGSTADVAVLAQTPHSMFWNYDAIGYISMGLATLIAVPALDRVGPDRPVRRAFIAHAAMTPLIAFVYFYPTYSNAVLMLGLPWAVTAPAFMFLLGRRLGDRGRRPQA
jgi:hypothetical protein